MSDLTPEERAIYEWQMWIPGFGEEGQRKLKGASVLISRVGGLGGVVAYQLAAAGIGRLVLAMGGKVKPSDLHRHLQQSHDRIGEPRLPGSGEAPAGAEPARGDRRGGGKCERG